MLQFTTKVQALSPLTIQGPSHVDEKPIMLVSWTGSPPPYISGWPQNDDLSLPQSRFNNFSMSERSGI